jgi:large subunit ribosomal protein L26e
MRGQFKKTEGRVVSVYRKKYCIHVEKCTRDKANGQSIHVPLDASNCMITKLKLDKSRKQILERKNRGLIGNKEKSKYPEASLDNLAGVD